MRCCDTNPFQTNKKTKLDKINFENLYASFFAFDFDVYFLVQAIASHFMFIYSSWHGFHDELICSLPFDKAVDSLNTEQLLSTSFQRTWERVRRNDFTFISQISFKMIYHKKFTRNETNCITRLVASLRFWSCWNVSLVKWTVIWYFFSWNTSHSAITCVKHFDSRYFYQNQTQMQGHRRRKIQNKCKALINTSHYMQCDN